MKNLALAICKVMAAASHVQKTGKNSFHGYNYASDGDLLRVLQPAMAEAGLIMVPTQIGQSDKQMDKGKTQTDVHVQYTLVHTSGESMTIQAVGRGIDKEDKGPYKAMTGALKYALRQTFLVPTGDDPEVHSNAHEPEARKGRQSNPAPTPKRQAPQSKEKPRETKQPQQENPSAPPCPKCGGDMWDDSERRRNGGKAPAYKCKDSSYDSNTKTSSGCQGKIWDVDDGNRKNKAPQELFEVVPF